MEHVQRGQPHADRGLENPKVVLLLPWSRAEGNETGLEP